MLYRLVTSTGKPVGPTFPSMDALVDRVDDFCAKYKRVEAQRYDADLRRWVSNGHYFGN